jgi:hypothetical protein
MGVRATCLGALEQECIRKDPRYGERTVRERHLNR